MEERRTRTSDLPLPVGIFSVQRLRPLPVETKDLRTEVDSGDGKEKGRCLVLVDEKLNTLTLRLKITPFGVYRDYK